MEEWVLEKSRCSSIRGRGTMRSSTEKRRTAEGGRRDTGGEKGEERQGLLEKSRCIRISVEVQGQIQRREVQ